MVSFFFVYNITAARRRSLSHSGSLSKRRFFRLIIIFNKASSTPGMMGFLGLLRRIFLVVRFYAPRFFFLSVFIWSFFLSSTYTRPGPYCGTQYIYTQIPAARLRYVCPANRRKIIDALLNNTHVFFFLWSAVLQGVQQDVRQRLPSPKAHDKPR